MKFCGMCGAPLTAALDDAAGDVSPAGAEDVREPVEMKAPSRTPTAPPSSTPAPAYTGGTFRLMGQEVDPPSRNLDYLLEDDEESASGRGGWILALLLALALAGGLGYWHYRNGGWPGAKLSASKSSEPEASAATSPTSGDNTVSAPAAAGNASTTAAPPAAAALTDVRPQNPAASLAASPQAPAQDTQAPSGATDTGKPASPDVPALPTKHPAPARPDAPVKAEDPVTLGEKYLYGRGLPQSCERGLKLVRPAADASNGKAMITMGALYATGHCVSRDLPTAYRYFALALRKDPDNGALKQNAEMVWGQMTQSERQQAIRLTQ